MGEQKWLLESSLVDISGKHGCDIIDLGVKVYTWVPKYRLRCENRDIGLEIYTTVRKNVPRCESVGMGMKIQTLGMPIQTCAINIKCIDIIMKV